MEKVFVKLLKLREQIQTIIEMCPEYQNLIAEDEIEDEETIIEPEVYECITFEQKEEIEHLCKNYPDMLTDMINRLKLEDLSYMRKSDYRQHIERLRKIVDIRRQAEVRKEEE